VAGERTCWSRRFGRPGRLSPNEQVWLLLEGFPPGTTARLNGQPVALAGVDVTPLLEVRNELVLELGAAKWPPPQSDEPPGLATLEIRSADL
jgi:hypothetical protein